MAKAPPRLGGVRYPLRDVLCATHALDATLIAQENAQIDYFPDWPF